MGAHLGELYALGTAVCWVGTAMFFTAAGARVGSMVVNLLRLIMALLILIAVAWWTRGLALPTDASGHAWLWLSISGVVGFTFGDLCLFRAFLLLGPRLSTLIMSFAPPITVVVGWIWLGEDLGPWQLAGIATTLLGVLWAVLDRTPSGRASISRSERRLGILLGLGGAIGQAVGLVLSKHGMGDYDVIAANQIRVSAGALGFALLFTVIGWWPRVRRAVVDAKGMALTGGGAFAGPFLGVTLSLLAVQHTEAGVAASIMGTTPVMIIPWIVLSGQERVGPGGVLGALIACAGVAMLFLAPGLS